MIRGLVIGKFYPPHKGHKYLIDTALSQVDHLAIIVCQKQDEFIPGKLRAEWLKKIHPKAKVILIDCDNLEPNNSKLWANLTIKWLGYKPDVVFTSEDYGSPYAKYLECKHVLVDRQRIKYQISGTKVRSNPLKYLNFLEPVVRAYFVKRVCVVGAESTGTTTMAKALAKYFKTCWVPEYGRVYFEGKMYGDQSNTWSSEEFAHIAAMQNIVEDELAKRSNKVLICDTNSFATNIWHDRYIGGNSKEVEKLFKTRHYDLYLLTDVDIPFEQDGTRDGEHLRGWMHQRFVEELRKRHQNFIILSGTHSKRLEKSVETIKKLIHESVN